MVIAEDPGAGLRQVDFDRVGPAIGTRLPPVALPDQSGSVVDLEEFRAGRPAMLVVYRSAGW
jgi:hypothetical protein